MKVKFIGATKSVTGSCSLLYHEASDTQFLVDCGGYIEGQFSEWKNNQDFPFNAKELKFVLLTHAHYDHCGLLPKLYKQGFIGEVICTEATAELVRIILQDSEKHTYIYDSHDVKKVRFKYIDRDPRFSWGKPFSVLPDLRITFLRSSHILGASSIQVNWGVESDGKGKNIHFSGDIGSNSDKAEYLPLLKPNHYPFPTTNYLVVESTYGGKTRKPQHKLVEERRNYLKSIIEGVILKGYGKVLIPTFAMHRAQEICADLLYVTENMLDKKEVEAYLQTKESRGNNFKITFDSKMLAKVNQIYANLLPTKNKNGKYLYLSSELGGVTEPFLNLMKEGYLPCENIKGFFKVFGLPPKDAKKSKTNYDEEREQNRMPSSSVIVASGGMCDTGPVTQYLDLMKSNQENAIVFTGFLSQGSIGKKIKDGEINDFKGQVFDMSSFYSGHADEESLLDFIFELGERKQNNSGTKVFINHGTPQSKEQLKVAIESRSQIHSNERNVDEVITLDGSESWYNLDKGEFEQPEIHKDITQELLSRITSLESEVALLNRSFGKLNDMQ